MNANDQFFARDAKVDSAAVAPLPASRKIYVEGTRPDVRVPMREIAQSDTPASFGAEKNPPLAVYDTSGPYTDPAARIDIREGLPGLRTAWIDERADTVTLDAPTSAYGRARLADPALTGMRFDLHRSRSTRITPARSSPTTTAPIWAFASASIRTAGATTPARIASRGPRTST